MLSAANKALHSDKLLAARGVEGVDLLFFKKNSLFYGVQRPPVSGT